MQQGTNILAGEGTPQAMAHPGPAHDHRQAVVGKWLEAREAVKKKLARAEEAPDSQSALEIKWLHDLLQSANSAVGGLEEEQSQHITALLLADWCVKADWDHQTQLAVNMSSYAEIVTLKKRLEEEGALTAFILTNYAREIGEGRHRGQNDAQIAMHYMRMERRYTKGISKWWQRLAFVLGMGVRG